MTYRDLATTIQRIRQFSEKANRGVERRGFAWERLSLQSGPTKLEISADFSEQSLIQGPQLATDVWYSLRNDYAPISEVTLRLGDYSRELTVSGTDRTQVEGLVLLAQEDLARIGCALGGSTTRSIGGLALILAGWVLGSAAITARSRSDRARVALLASAVVMFVAVLFFPWDQWLPGTAVRVARVSLLERYAPIIGFVGTVAGLVSVAIALSSRLRRLLPRSRPKDGAE